MPLWPPPAEERVVAVRVEPADPDVGRHREALEHPVGLAAIPALAALVPKCPVCVAVYLTAFGVSLRPAALVAGALALLTLARTWLRRRADDG